MEIKDFSASMLTESLHFFLKEKHETANDQLGEMKCITIGYSKNCGMSEAKLSLICYLNFIIIAMFRTAVGAATDDLVTIIPTPLFVLTLC